MRWISDPISDAVWFLSGAPLGLLFATGKIPFPIIIHVFIALNTAHLFAPIAMAWSHRGFRSVMMERKGQFILLPSILVGIGLLVGFLSWLVGAAIEVNPITLAARFPGPRDFLHSPLTPVLVIYFVWNLYHFAMQNYGLLRLYCLTMNKALAMQLAMFGTVMLIIVLPEKFHMPQLFLFVLGAIIFNHQLAALGIAAHIWANHHRRSQVLFVVPLLMIGGLAAYGSSYLAGLLLPLVIGARSTMGFGHFLYDRWVYKLSDPQVRTTIGSDLVRRLAAQSTEHAALA